MNTPSAAAHSRRPADDGNRLPLTAAALLAPAAERPLQRADVLPHIVEELTRDRDEDVAMATAATTAAARGFFGMAAFG